jgi:hypothetical protein
LICYEKEDYEMCKSNKTINSSRLKKLDNINTNELLVIKNLLLANKIPGYQEKNINKIIWYINKFK